VPSIDKLSPRSYLDRRVRRRAETRELELLMDEAAACLDRGDLRGALERADAARARAPRFAPALHCRAAALAELGRLGEAREAYEEALSAEEGDLDLLASAADFFVNRLQESSADREWLDRGLELARRGSKAARGRDPDAAAEFALLEGMALSQLGEPGEALPRLEAALSAHPEDLEAMLERGFALYELCRFEDAAGQLREVVRRSPDEAWAHHTLGLVAEHLGKLGEAERCFARARALDADEFPGPVELSPEAFDAAVEDALAALPEQVREYLSNVAIAVEDLPADEDLLGSDPPLSPSILGIFRGAPLGQKASPDPWSHFPSSIVLYQRNLARFARDRRELIEQIGVTLIHEVGHFLGLDEQELWERGLE
jgi:predicted Zn-dependent protease with MMP-like domain/Flp pilus assembly protein TadD